jgi:hypothetical protein
MLVEGVTADGGQVLGYMLQLQKGVGVGVESLKVAVSEARSQVEK